MNAKKFLFTFVIGLALVPGAQAQIKHVEMRVEGMT